MSEAHWRPALLFDTNEAEFVRGFEAGRLWGYLRDKPDLAVDGYLHASNTEMALRIAESQEREVISKELEDNWLIVTFSARGRTIAETIRQTYCISKIYPFHSP